MRKIKVLVVSPPALAQLIKHLFHERPEFEVLGSLETLKHLARYSGRRPDLIVASVKPMTIGVCPAVVSIKKSSPVSKVVLICPIRDFIRGALKCGADACLEQENLVFHLLATARSLSNGSRGN
jgi:hypothetical protein